MCRYYVWAPSISGSFNTTLKAALYIPRKSISSSMMTSRVIHGRESLWDIFSYLCSSLGNKDHFLKHTLSKKKWTGWRGIHWLWQPALNSGIERYKGYANLIYTYSLGLPSLYSLDVAVGSCLTQQEIGSPSIWVRPTSWSIRLLLGIYVAGCWIWIPIKLAARFSFQ